MKSQCGMVILLLAMATALNAYNPIVMWSKKNLGDNWKAGTEISEPMSDNQFSTIVKDIIQHRVLVLIEI